MCVSLPFSCPLFLFPLPPTPLQPRNANPVSFPRKGGRVTSCFHQQWVRLSAFPWLSTVLIPQTFWEWDSKNFGVPSLPRRVGSRSEKSSPRTASIASMCSSDITGRSGTSLGTPDTVGYSSGRLSQGTSGQHRPFCSFILLSVLCFFPSPIFLAFLHSTASSPLSFPFKVGQLFAWALFRIKLATKNSPKVLSISLYLRSPHCRWDDRQTPNTESRALQTVLFLYSTTRHSVYARSWGTANLSSQMKTEEHQQGIGLTGRLSYRPLCAQNIGSGGKRKTALPDSTNTCWKPGWATNHKGIILEATGTFGNWSGASSHMKSCWFILGEWKKAGHCWDLTDHFWLSHKWENLSHRQSTSPEISLALATSLISPNSWIYEKEKENNNKFERFCFPFIWPDISNKRSTKYLLEPIQASNLW